MRIEEQDGRGNVIRSFTVADDPIAVNEADLAAKVKAALTANNTYLAIVSPTTAQVAAQVRTLTKECSGLIRLLTRNLDDVTGT